MQKNIFVILLVAMLFVVIGCGGDNKPTKPKGKTPAVSEEVKAALQGTGSFSGTVRFQGDVPQLKKINMTTDCKSKHSGDILEDNLVLGEGNALANVFLCVKSGLPKGYYPPIETAAVIDQNGCFYNPHVLAVMVGQKVRILNSDGIFHNVHIHAKLNEEQNIGMTGEDKETMIVFTKEESMFNIKCDVHPWMVNYVTVVSHPYFAVTGKDGKFQIPKLQAGKYEVEVWHELGEQVVVEPGKAFTLELKDGEQKVQDFTVKLKK